MANNMVLRPQSFEQLVQFAQMAAKSAMVPAAYKEKPEDIMLAIQMGSELGLAPMASLQNIACINGRPSVYGDALIGLCRHSPTCKDIEEKVEGEGDAMVATCTATRVGSSPVIGIFSVADARKASLWGKAGPWTLYPRRMLAMRARGFALRDAFPDVLRGLITAEEAADLPADRHRGPTIEAQPQPVPEPPAPPDPQTNGTSEVVQWFKDLDAVLWQADGEGVDAIEARPDVQKMLDDHGRPKARDRLKFMLDVHRKRTTPVEADDEVTAPNEPSVEQQVANELNGYDNDPLMEPRDELQQRTSDLVSQLGHANSATITKFTANPLYVKFLAEIKSRPELLVQVRDAAIAASQR